jgi:hypothetical protein
MTCKATAHIHPDKVLHWRPFRSEIAARLIADMLTKLTGDEHYIVDLSSCRHIIKRIDASGKEYDA